MATTCESCGQKNPKVFERGPFVGSAMELDYCTFCSMDLCDDCMRDDECTDGPKGEHEPEGDDED